MINFIIGWAEVSPPPIYIPPRHANVRPTLPLFKIFMYNATPSNGFLDRGSEKVCPSCLTENRIPAFQIRFSQHPTNAKPDESDRTRIAEVSSHPVFAGAFSCISSSSHFSAGSVSKRRNQGTSPTFAARGANPGPVSAVAVAVRDTSAVGLRVGEPAARHSVDVGQLALGTHCPWLRQDSLPRCVIQCIQHVSIWSKGVFSPLFFLCPMTRHHSWVLWIDNWKAFEFFFGAKCESGWQCAASRIRFKESRTHFSPRWGAMGRGGQVSPPPGPKAPGDTNMVIFDSLRKISLVGKHSGPN